MDEADHSPRSSPLGDVGPTPLLLPQKKQQLVWAFLSVARQDENIASTLAGFTCIVSIHSGHNSIQATGRNVGNSHIETRFEKESNLTLCVCGQNESGESKPWTPEFLKSCTMIATFHEPRMNQLKPPTPLPCRRLNTSAASGPGGRTTTRCLWAAPGPEWEIKDV